MLIPFRAKRVCVYQHSLFLLDGRLLTFTLSQRRVTVQILQKFDLYLWLLAFLKHLSLSLVGRFSSIYRFTIILIDSMDSAKGGPQTIVWLFQLNLGYAFLGVKVQPFLLSCIYEKVFDWVCLKSKLSTILLLVVCLSLYLDRKFSFWLFNATLVYCHCSIPIRSEVPHRSVLSPSLLLFIKDVLSQTHCTSVLMTLPAFLTIFVKVPSQQGLNESRRHDIHNLTFDLTVICEWVRENLVIFSASKTQFFLLSTKKKKTLQTTVPSSLMTLNWHPFNTESL